MATTRRPRPRTRPTPVARTAAPTTTAASVAPIGQGVDLSRRMQVEYISISDITPYEYNPRDNEKAIPAVASSIQSFGFLVPCVVDQNNVLVAGHTRVEAAKLLHMTDVPCIRASYLTQAQVNAFRLIDNKVSEAAQWNFDLLSGEIAKIADLGLDFTQFGWDQSEIDCLSEVVGEECLTSPVNVTPEDEAAVSQRRAPTTARFVLGELVFFIPATTYRSWVDGVRQLCNFNEEAISAELKRRLGIAQ